MVAVKVVVWAIGLVVIGAEVIAEVAAKMAVAVVVAVHLAAQVVVGVLVQVLAVAIALQDVVQLAQAFVDRGVILFVKPHVKIHVQPILVQIVVLRDVQIAVKMFVQ